MRHAAAVRDALRVPKPCFGGSKVLSLLSVPSVDSSSVPLLLEGKPVTAKELSECQG